MHISYAVRIDAQPQAIWGALVDVERWPEFAPQFKNIVRSDEGPLALGKTARVTPHGFFGSVWMVTRFEQGRSFLWEADVIPGVHLAADHIVAPDGDGAEVTMALESSGPLSLVLMLALGRIFRRNTREEAEGLKAYCEAGP